MSASVQMFAFNTAIAKELKERVALLAAGKLTELKAPSEYQRAIFDFVARERGSLIVRAVAGSGKTTTCVHSLKFIPGVDVSRVRASTFHSVGFGAVAKKLAIPFERIDTNGSKVSRLAREALNELDHDLYGSFCSRLVGLAKGQGVGCLVPDEAGAWHEIIAHHDLYLEDERADEGRAVEIARQLLKKSNEVAREGFLDFDDQLYLPILWRLRLWQNDVVYVDEAQDTNPVRRAIAKMALRPGGRLIAVGDERQAIYGFTGASHDAMDLIRKEFDCRELPLTVSYRCPSKVGELARELVPYFETAPAAIEGSVDHMPVKEALKVLDSHDVVLCRQTRPLFDLAFKLIAKGVGCAILGRDIAKGLVDLIKKRRASGIPNLVSKLEAFRDSEVSRFMAKGEEAKAEAISDRVGCVLCVIDNLHERERTVPGLIARLEGMFTDGNGVLVLSTQHKAKGREWRRVAILSPGLNPSPWARQDWQALQERNLMYVAWTRCTERLIFLTDEGKDL